MVAGQRTQQESRVSTSEVRRLPSISRPADFALNLVLRAAYQVFKALFCFTGQDQLLLGNKLFCHYIRIPRITIKFSLFSPIYSLDEKEKLTICTFCRGDIKGVSWLLWRKGSSGWVAYHRT